MLFYSRGIILLNACTSMYQPYCNFARNSQFQAYLRMGLFITDNKGGIKLGPVYTGARLSFARTLFLLGLHSLCHLRFIPN